MNRRRVLLLSGAAGLAAIACGVPVINAANSNAKPQWVPPQPRPAPEGSTEPEPAVSTLSETLDISKLDPAKIVSITASGWHSWALLDRGTGAILGSANAAETNRACSMIKSWVAADYLRQKPSPSAIALADIEIMIRDSDSVSADRLMDQIGRSASFKRLQDLCKTTEFTPIASWSRAEISARDMVRAGEAIGRGAIANDRWTDHLLTLMRTVRRGTWGIRDAFPADARPAIAVKNGWDITAEDGTRHINCLAIHDRWVMVALTRYPASLKAGDAHGQGICKSIAEQLLNSGELRPLFA